MKKLILMMTSIVSVSPILNNANFICVDRAINRIAGDLSHENKKQLYDYKAKDSGNVGGRYILDSTVQLNPADNKPFGNKPILDAQGYDEQRYMDNVFLKSLQWDSNKEHLVSSMDNLISWDQKDPSSLYQDKADYEMMEHLGTNGLGEDIEEGVNTVNSYINDNTATFNYNGYIPERDTFFKDVSSDNINSNDKQTVVTFTDTGKDYSYNSDDQTIGISLHWYGISMDMPEKYMTGPTITSINIYTKKMNGVYNIIKNSNAFASQDDPKTLLSWYLNDINAKQNDPQSSQGELRADAQFEEEVSTKYNLSAGEDIELDDIVAAPNATTAAGQAATTEVDGPINTAVETVAASFSETLQAAAGSVYGYFQALAWTNPVTTFLLTCLVLGVCAGIIIGVPAFIIGLIILLLAKIATGAGNSDMSLEDYLYNSNTKQFNTANSATLNFKSWCSSNWDKSNRQCHVTPEYAKIVPQADVLPSTVSPDLDKNYNLIAGSNDDFNIIMDPTTWLQFTELALANSPALSVNSFLKKSRIFNSNLYLTGDDWYDIVKNQLKYTHLDNDSVAVLHIVNKKVVYCNITDSSGKTNMKFDTSGHLKESFIGTDINHMDLIANREQIGALESNLNVIRQKWNDYKINGKTMTGIKNNALDNPNHYQTYQEWYYNVYIKNTFWADKNINENDIVTFLSKLSEKTEDGGFSQTQNVEMQNNNDNILDIPVSMLQ